MTIVSTILILEYKQYLMPGREEEIRSNICF